MKATRPEPPVYEFYFPDVDTLLQVREAEDAVEIRATRNTFSDQRKTRFIRELASEGFIPDGCQWFSSGMPPACPGVRWLVDISWLALPRVALAETNRRMMFLLAGALLLWLVLMLFLLSP